MTVLLTTKTLKGILSYSLMIGTGTVYKISTPKTDKVYIGSTTTPINRRFSSHKSRPCCSCKELLELGECKIEALEVLYNCTKRELEIKEQYYLNLLKELTVNKKRAHQTKEDRRKQKADNNKKWKLENPELYKQKKRDENERRKERLAKKMEEG